MTPNTVVVFVGETDTTVTHGEVGVVREVVNTDDTGPVGMVLFGCERLLPCEPWELDSAG